VAVDASGNVYVTDSQNHCVQKFTSGGKCVAKWGSMGSEQGEFYWAYGIDVDKVHCTFVGKMIGPFV
jgi:hypothetical protein